MQRRTILIAAGVFVLLGMAGASVYPQLIRPARLDLYVFSLKSGRAILIRTPRDRRILIDGGSSSEIIRAVSRVLPFYSRRIDMLIATTDSARDVSGLVDIIRRYQVQKIYVPALTLGELGLASTTDPIYAEFLATAGRLHVKKET